MDACTDHALASREVFVYPTSERSRLGYFEALGMTCVISLLQVIAVRMNRALDLSEVLESVAELSCYSTPPQVHSCIICFVDGSWGMRFDPLAVRFLVCCSILACKMIGMLPTLLIDLIHTSWVHVPQAALKSVLYTVQMQLLRSGRETHCASFGSSLRRIPPLPLLASYEERSAPLL